MGFFGVFKHESNSNNNNNNKETGEVEKNEVEDANKKNPQEKLQRRGSLVDVVKKMTRQKSKEDNTNDVNQLKINTNLSSGNSPMSSPNSAASQNSQSSTFSHNNNNNNNHNNNQQQWPTRQPEGEAPTEEQLIQYLLMKIANMESMTLEVDDWSENALHYFADNAKFQWHIITHFEKMTFRFLCKYPKYFSINGHAVTLTEFGRNQFDVLTDKQYHHDHPIVKSNLPVAAATKTEVPNHPIHDPIPAVVEAPKSSMHTIQQTLNNISKPQQGQGQRKGGGGGGSVRNAVADLEKFENDMSVIIKKKVASNNNNIHTTANDTPSRRLVSVMNDLEKSSNSNNAHTTTVLKKTNDGNETETEQLSKLLHDIESTKATSTGNHKSTSSTATTKMTTQQQNQMMKELDETASNLVGGGHKTDKHVVTIAEAMANLNINQENHANVPLNHNNHHINHIINNDNDEHTKNLLHDLTDLSKPQDHLEHSSASKDNLANDIKELQDSLKNL